MSGEATQHTVRDGEDMAGIAHRYGFFWKTLWTLPENAELKDRRKNPNILSPGDTVHVPALRKRQESGATEQRHRFKRKGVPSRVRMRLLRHDEPRANLPYTFESEGTTVEGQTDGDGYLELAVPPQATFGTLRLKDGQNTEERTLRFGNLHPVETTEGVQQRLRNLGLKCNVNGEVDDETKQALTQFQQKHDLEPTGDLEDTTRNKLKEVHGS